MKPGNILPYLDYKLFHANGTPQVLEIVFRHTNNDPVTINNKNWVAWQYMRVSHLDRQTG